VFGLNDKDRVGLSLEVRKGGSENQPNEKEILEKYLLQYNYHTTDQMLGNVIHYDKTI
jgi:oligoribonuclease (3'-5' exoribonuclease)